MDNRPAGEIDRFDEQSRARLWEERWRVETDETSRRLLQGLIQIAAGLHKFVAVRDPASASRLLAKGLAKLDGCAEVAEFRAGMVACANALALDLG